jgi:hypothetical protein
MGHHSATLGRGHVGTAADAKAIRVLFGCLPIIEKLVHLLGTEDLL